MKCVAVGDMMIPSIYFRRELEKSSIIDEFICKSWKENSSKDDFREVIRKIETQGACAFEVEDEITELMKKADVIFVHQCPVSKEVIKEAENLKYILHRIVNQRERDEGEQGCYNQQSDTDLCQRIVHLFYQVVLISNLGNTWICLQFLGNPLQ